MKTKTCYKCGTERPITDFMVQRRTEPMVCITCPDCRRVRTPWEKLRSQLANHKSRAKQAGVKSDLTVDDWLRVLKRANGKCEYCGQIVGSGSLTIDHVVAIKVGGENTIANIKAACGLCNRRKLISMEGEMKCQFNVRLSIETMGTISALSSILECSQADVVRQAVRLLAKRDLPKKNRMTAENPGKTAKGKK